MRRLAILAGAAACGAVLPHLLQLDRADPFFWTVTVLPVVAAGLALVGDWARGHGARGLPGKHAQAQVLALAALVLLVATRRQLGFPWADHLVMAGLVALLGGHLVRLLVALRPTLGQRLPGRPPAAFFLLPLLTYAAVAPWGARHRTADGDEPYYLLIAHSLAFDLDADLGNNYEQSDSLRFMPRAIEPQPGDPTGTEGQRYSRHNLLLPLVLALPYRLAGRGGAILTMAVLAAALGWSTLRLARHYHPHQPGAALAAYALFSFAPPVLLYSQQVWIEVPAALLVVLALDALHELERSATRPAVRWLRLALPVLLLPLLKARLILLSAALTLLALVRLGRKRREALLLALSLLGLTATVLAFNSRVFGNPLKIHGWQEMLPHPPLGELAASFVGLFFDCAFGLFACSPIWLLLLPALLLLFTESRKAALDLALVALPYLVALASRREWYGGWSPPFRYGMVILPLFAIALIPLLARRRRGGARALVSALGLLTLVLSLVWILEPGWAYNFAHGSNRLLDALARRSGLDLIHLFPSSVRPRPATWIWPPLSLLVCALLWWWPRRRWRFASQLGIAALLSSPGVLLLAAQRLPSRVVELEDAWVRPTGGSIYPSPWTPDRTRFRGAWLLPGGQSLTVPLVAGGSQLEVSLDVRCEGRGQLPVTLALGAGERQLATVRVSTDGEWRSIHLGPFPWPAGEELRLTARHPRNRRAGVILDRARLTWR